MLRRADAVEHDLLHRRHHVVVEEPVHHPDVEGGAGIVGNQPQRPGMMEAEMLDDDARLHDRPVLVEQHGHALQRPEGRELRGRFLVAGREHAELERGAVLVEGDQHLLAVRRERVCVELHRHLRLRSAGLARPSAVIDPRPGLS
jgi:hypothetical protein